MSGSDSDEENVIRYGTPLEPFDEDEVPSKRKYQQPPDQFAVDAHGRRRFHGAFTGGFSAGFGNTVGTPEGWTPTAFKSSRAEKAQLSSQRPEDFMDDEDRGEFGIAPRHVQTHNEFSGQKRPRQRQFHDGPIPGEPVLEQLVRAVHETAAVRILRQMGWREGQGAGDRVTRGEKRRAREQHKVYGCYVPAEMRQAAQNTETHSDEDSTDSEFDFETLFAPDDYEPYLLARKDDRFGLGYSGLSRHSVLGNLVGEYGSDAGTSRSHLVMKEKGKKVSIRGQAFGVGAFEADDDDIYATEDMSHYDFALGSESKPKAKPAGEKGNNVIPGFVKAKQPLPAAPAHPPPALPRDYAPAAAGSRRSRFEPSTQPQRDQGLGRHELTAEARGALLGETPLPEPVQEEIQPVQTTQSTIEDPIAKLLGRNVNFVTTNSSSATHTVLTSQEEPKELDFISIKDSGKELTKVFKPFMSDPQKQARYERYVRNKDSYAVEGDGATNRLSEWERNRELIEFEQAAKLYKPLTGVMGDRFTHASQPDEAVNPLCAVAKSSTDYGLATPQQVEAAERGAYGVMTRREASWRPEALVCKRFNVPEPGVTRNEAKKEDKPKVSYSIFSYLESSVHDRDSFAKEQSKFSGSKSINSEVTPKMNHSGVPNLNNSGGNTNISDSIFDNTKEIGTTSENSELQPSTSDPNTGFNKRLTVAELFLKESERNKEQGVEVTETINKFDKMDLYKSIFLSDSEDEDDVPIAKEHKEINFDELFEVPKNVERNLSPPKGIFANINFDELNSWKRNASNKTPNQNLGDQSSHNKTPNKNKAEIKEGDSNTEIVNVETGEDADIYGPKIPENLKKRLESSDSIANDNFKPVFRSKTDKAKEIVEIDSSSSSDSWVDVKEVKSKKLKKKKSKKHKSKHKKSKVKHKKKVK